MSPNTKLGIQFFIILGFLVISPFMRFYREHYSLLEETSINKYIILIRKFNFFKDVLEEDDNFDV